MLIYIHTHTHAQTSRHPHTHSWWHTHTPMWQSNDYENGSDRALLKPEAASRRTSRLQKRMRFEVWVWVWLRVRVLESIRLQVSWVGRRGGGGNSTRWQSRESQAHNSLIRRTQMKTLAMGMRILHASATGRCHWAPPLLPPPCAICFARNFTAAAGIIQIAYKFSLVVTFGW